MARTVHHLRILISSPSDVALEREAAVQVINEINSLLGSNREVYLEAIRWETDVSLGIGADTQEVVNRQLPEYDVFLGIMWTRFGTPTSRAGSGTAEEFECAVARWEKAHDSVDIKFYFSNVLVPPKDLDTTQLAMLQKFKETLPQRGVLYREYTSLDEFKTLLRNDFMTCARNYAVKPGAADEKPVATSPSHEILEEGEKGILDIFAEVEQAVSQAGASLGAISVSIDALGQSMSARTAEMDQLVAISGGGQPSAIKAQRIVNDAAEDLTSFAVGLQTNLPKFREAWGVVVDRIGGVLAMEQEVTQEELIGAKSVLARTDSQMEYAFENMAKFRATMAGIPGLTYRYRKACRQVLEAMDSLLEEFRRARSFLGQLTTIVDEKLAKLSAS